MTSIKKNIYGFQCFCSIFLCLVAHRGTWSRFFEFTYRQEKILPTWHEFHCLSAVIFWQQFYHKFCTNIPHHVSLLNDFHLKTLKITLEHSQAMSSIFRSFSSWPEISTERVQEHRNYFYTIWRTKNFTHQQVCPCLYLILSTYIVIKWSFSTDSNCFDSNHQI